MNNLAVRYFKAQLKIQEMAFVTVAIVLFFLITGIFLLNIWGTGMKAGVESQRMEKAGEIALKIADSPELKWSLSTANCENCIDLDKAMALKERIETGSIYKDFWGNDINSIKIELLYPKNNGECNKDNYPDCKTITLFNKTREFSYYGSYVALCRHDEQKGGYFRCGLGRIDVSAKGLE